VTRRVEPRRERHEAALSGRRRAGTAHRLQRPVEPRRDGQVAEQARHLEQAQHERGAVRHHHRELDVVPAGAVVGVEQHPDDRRVDVVRPAQVDEQRVRAVELATDGPLERRRIEGVERAVQRQHADVARL
jgi:hypothetical protein